MKFKSKVEKDDAKLYGYLKNNAPEYIEKFTTEKTKWGEFKKTLEFMNGKCLTPDGEVLDFITETTDEEFVVEV